MTARFLSADPVFEPQKPQSLNGYAYANNNPATFTDPTGLSYDDIFGAIGAIIGGIVGAVITIIGAVLGTIGSTGNTGGTATTSSTGSTGGSTNRWQPGVTYNFITKSWDTPFMNRGGMSLQDLVAAQRDWGIVQDNKANNGWENRSMFIGWLWGGGYPLGDHQQFRGGDAFTSVLAVDGSVTEMRAKLLGQAMEQGMNAPAAKEAEAMHYQDTGPDPSSSFWHFNTGRGVFNDVASIATNGAIGTKNRADAFLGTWSGEAGIKSINKKSGTVTLKFHAYNTSDWQSATHAVPRSWNPRFADTFGAAVKEDFNWEEKWPVNECVNTSALSRNRW